MAATKGPIDPELLAQMVDEGSSIAHMSRTLGYSVNGVRRYLKQYGLYVPPRHLPSKGCVRHGLKACKRCRADGVAKRRRDIKSELAQARGGRCEHPGCPVPGTYVFSMSELDFHHRDPSTKIANLSNWSYSLRKAEIEADKCDLLCALCHRRVETSLRGQTDMAAVS